MGVPGHRLGPSGSSSFLLPEDAASPPRPQPSSSDDHNQGFLSFAGKDVLLSVLATHNVIGSEREMRGVSEPGEPGGGGEQLA